MMKDANKSFLELSKRLKPLEDGEKGQLRGGFSALSADLTDPIKVNGVSCPTNSNCHGANCVSGCGGG